MVIDGEIGISYAAKASPDGAVEADHWLLGPILHVDESRCLRRVVGRGNQIRHQVRNEPAILEGCITMPRGPTEAVVTKFLRGVLGVDAVGVVELGAKARAAGLLAEGQSKAPRNRLRREAGDRVRM
jgi:hypothetical protein